MTPTQDHEGVAVWTIDNWADFMAHFKSGAKREYVWRGQGDAKWSLKSSLTRFLENRESEMEALALESTTDDDDGVDELAAAVPLNKDRRRDLCGKKPGGFLLDRFREFAKATPTGDLEGVQDAATLGRHHGLLTPSLDWTKSPFVAAYFALVERSANAAYRAVWGFLLDQQAKNKFTTNSTWSHLNKRMIAQQGVTISIDEDGSFLDAVKEAFPDWQSNERLIRFNLRSAFRVDAIRSLNRMNINHLTLFPDLEGAAQHANHHLEFSNY